MFKRNLQAAVIASILGFLVHEQQGMSVTGKLIWECTYNVAGNPTTVLLEYLCPPSMQFD